MGIQNCLLFFSCFTFTCRSRVVLFCNLLSLHPLSSKLILSPSTLLFLQPPLESSSSFLLLTKITFQSLHCCPLLSFEASLPYLHLLPTLLSLTSSCLRPHQSKLPLTLAPFVAATKTLALHRRIDFLFQGTVVASLHNFTFSFSLILWLLNPYFSF